jgi:hypothetical protein
MHSRIHHRQEEKILRIDKNPSQGWDFSMKDSLIFSNKVFDQIKQEALNKGRLLYISLHKEERMGMVMDETSRTSVRKSLKGKRWSDGKRFMIPCLSCDIRLVWKVMGRIILYLNEGKRSSQHEALLQVPQRMKSRFVDGEDKILVKVPSAGLICGIGFDIEENEFTVEPQGSPVSMSDYLAVGRLLGFECK